ncbi:MAG: hypothetical protein R2745_19615 [Vicinamibacterales bacterium]
MQANRALPLTVVIALLVLPGTSAARQHGQHHPSAPADAAVDFGVLPTAPIGPPPCLQSGAIGGPADPCSYLLHHLTPEETTVAKGGQVTFQIHGGGHAFAIYAVSRKTTRDALGQFLCAGPDPATVPDPAGHPCNLSALNANGAHVVEDGKGDVVLDVAANVTNAHPDNRVWSEAGRLTSAGGQQFLNGGTVPAGATSNGQLVTYRFLKTGRYLVLCMNRTHFLNDWMFGFVNVVGDDD